NVPLWLAVVFLVEDVDRSLENEKLRCTPVGWFPNGYSSPCNIMRNLAEAVHNQCQESGIHIPCQSFDGHFHNLVRTAYVKPLTVFQLQKEPWKQAACNEELGSKYKKAEGCEFKDDIPVSRLNVSVTDDDLLDFVVKQKKKSTVTKTSYDLKLLSSFTQAEFSNLKEVFQAKQKQHKGEGLGDKPLTTYFEFITLYTLGNGEVIINVFGGHKLCVHHARQEYLEFEEKQTKNRQGSSPRHERSVKPKMCA
ncbi:hypothetical protein MAR_005420, partial [Mya arenaria]